MNIYVGKSIRYREFIKIIVWVHIPTSHEHKTLNDSNVTHM